jgi:FixJ family two-component response regulator
MSGLPLISVIDDDDSVRECLESLVRSFGFAVEVFPSAEALLCSDHIGDMRCLLLDVRMPGMTGLELQHQLAASDSGIPVIFMTA